MDCEKVLDVGAGSNPARKRIKRCKYKVYHTLDIEGNPDFKWDINYYKKPEELFGFDPYPQYDVIFCLEVLEYCWNPYTAFQNLTNWLKKNGTLYLSTHFVYPIHPPKGRDMIRITRYWLEEQFKRFKYQLLEITPRVATKGKTLLEQFYSIEEMHTQKDETIYDIGYLCKGVK